MDGKKLKADQLIDLHFSYDNEGNFQCPVTFRTFTVSLLFLIYVYAIDRFVCLAFK